MTTTTTKKVMCVETPRAYHLVLEHSSTAMCGAKIARDDVYEPDRDVYDEATCKVCKHKYDERRIRLNVPSQLRRRLRKSEAYVDNAHATIDLWLDGFRPIFADTLAVGMTVAYRETDVFRFNCVGPVLAATVERITQEHEYGPLHVRHSHGETDVDECDEVWVKQ